jgi:hypothetical protein
MLVDFFWNIWRYIPEDSDPIGTVVSDLASDCIHQLRKFGI